LTNVQLIIQTNNLCQSMTSFIFLLCEWNEQWRSNSRFSRFNELGPPAVRGPRRPRQYFLKLQGKHKSCMFAIHVQTNEFSTGKQIKQSNYPKMENFLFVHRLPGIIILPFLQKCNSIIGTLFASISHHLKQSRPRFSTDLHYIWQECVFLHQMMTIKKNNRPYLNVYVLT